MRSQLHVQRLGRGRTRTRLDRVLGDKAYSSRANRTILRARDIKVTIAEHTDQVGTRRTADEQAAEDRPSTRRNNRQPDLTGVAGAHRDAGGRQLWYADEQQRANKVRWASGSG